MKVRKLTTDMPITLRVSNGRQSPDTKPPDHIEMVFNSMPEVNQIALTGPTGSTVYTREHVKETE